MRRGRQCRRAIERDVRFDHHHIAVLDESFHAAEQTHGSANGFIVLLAVRDGERRQNFADLLRVAL